MNVHLFTQRIVAVASVAASLCGASAFGDTLFAADNVNANLNGIVMFNPTNMSVNGSFVTSGPISGLASDSVSSVYASIGNGVYHYDTSGNVLNSYNPFAADHFDDLSIMGSQLFAADNTTVGLSGVVIFNAGSLAVNTTFLTSGVISGLAAGTGNDAYVSVGNGVFHYDTAGNLLGSYNPFAADHFDDLFLRGNTLYAVDNTTLGVSGVVEFNATTLAVQNTFLTSGVTSGLTGDSSNLFASITSGVYNLDTSGNVLQSYNLFPADHFDDLAYAAVPEPGTLAVLGLGLPFLLRRRAKK